MGTRGTFHEIGRNNSFPDKQLGIQSISFTKEIGKIMENEEELDDYYDEESETTQSIPMSSTSQDSDNNADIPRRLCDDRSAMSYLSEDYGDRPVSAWFRKVHRILKRRRTPLGIQSYERFLSNKQKYQVQRELEECEEIKKCLKANRIFLTENGFLDELKQKMKKFGVIEKKRDADNPIIFFDLSLQDCEKSFCLRFCSSSQLRN